MRTEGGLCAAAVWPSKDMQAGGNAITHAFALLFKLIISPSGMLCRLRRKMADSEDQALLQQQYQAMRMDANGLASKISELEQGWFLFSVLLERAIATSSHPMQITMSTSSFYLQWMVLSPLASAFALSVVCLSNARLLRYILRSTPTRRRSSLSSSH